MNSNVANCAQFCDKKLTNPAIRANDSAEDSCPARSGERLERLIQRHRPLLHKLCVRRMATMEDAEDLESAVVLTACRRFETYDPERGAFGTWLGAIVRHEASDMRRKAARQPQCVPNDHETELLIELTAGQEDEQTVLFEPIRAEDLPPLLRRAFALVKIEGLTCAEAGRAMGKTEGTVRTYVWKARQLMRCAA